MLTRTMVAGLLGLTALAGCNQDGDATKARLEALEARLGRIETRLANAEKDIPDAQALRDEVGEFDVRLGAAEARITEAMNLARSAPAPAAGGAGAPAGGAAAAAGAVTGGGAGAAQIDGARREALANLNAQYRERIDALRGTQQDATSMAQVRDARRELSRWFREQRRAILLGQGAATPPPTP